MDVNLKKHETIGMEIGSTQPFPVQTRAIVSVSGPYLRIDEIIGFRESAEKINSNSAGQAKLICIEPHFQLSIEMLGSLGEAEMEVKITPDHLTQDHSFLFSIDQSYLGIVIKQCKAIEKKFPLRE
jgi:hypothetical protein